MSAAEARKARSIARLVAEGVPHLTHLPPIEDEYAVMLRPDEEVAGRVLCLLAVARAGVTGDPGAGLEIIERSGVEACLTPLEKVFLVDPAPAEAERVPFSWRCEAAVPLIWALGWYQTMIPADRTIDLTYLCDEIMGLGDQFFEESRLRPAAEILDAADLTYRYHWAVREARRLQRLLPAGLNPSVVAERHHALNWLICYGGAEWDDVATDT